MRSLVAILLDGCESLAMVGLVVGLLVRHLEDADGLLDAYLAEPLIWEHEFARVVNEASPFAGDSNEVVAPERRKWSFRKAAMSMVARASDERASELTAVGKTLIENGRRGLESARELKTKGEDSASIELIDQELAPVRGWASSLDRDRYTVQKAPDGIYMRATPPDDVVQILADSNKDLELVSQANRLYVRYVIEQEKESWEAIGPEEMEADLNTARKILENPPSRCPHNPWDTCALVAAAVLEAHLIEAANLPANVLSLAAEILLEVGEGSTWPRQYEIEGTLCEQGADRSAARALPLLLLPVAKQLRARVDEADGSTTFDRALRAGLNCAHAVADEVRLHIGRGLDHVWKAPCVEHGRCHHELGWQITIETMRHSVLSDWNPETGQRSLLALNEPLTESLAGVAAESLLVSRLDGAIRALAPAATADICVSEQARDLLMALLAAQRRSLLNYENRRPDDRGTHTLVSARALLTLARDGDDTAIFEHINAYVDNLGLLENLLRALSAAAEETPERAATARRIWPKVVRHVLELNDSGHMPFQRGHFGDMALAALMRQIWQGRCRTCTARSMPARSYGGLHWS